MKITERQKEITLRMVKMDELKYKAYAALLVLSGCIVLTCNILIAKYIAFNRVGYILALLYGVVSLFATVFCKLRSEKAAFAYKLIAEDQIHLY